MLTFDEPSHRYFWNSQPVPNVTSIIGHLTSYDHIPPDKLERARLEGKAVHKMVELYFTKKEFTRPAWMDGHYTALLKFERETGFWCAGAERKVYHKLLRYAGTMDLVGGFQTLKDSKHVGIIDVKRSFFGGPAIGLQTEGYRQAYNNEEGGEIARERYALQLKPDGTYRLISYHDNPEHKEDGVSFLACLQQLRWRQRHYGDKRANR